MVKLYRLWFVHSIGENECSLDNRGFPRFEQGEKYRSQQMQRTRCSMFNRASVMELPVDDLAEPSKSAALRAIDTLVKLGVLKEYEWQ